MEDYTDQSTVQYAVERKKENRAGGWRAEREKKERDAADLAPSPSPRQQQKLLLPRGSCGRGPQEHNSQSKRSGEAGEREGHSGTHASLLSPRQPSLWSFVLAVLTPSLQDDEAAATGEPRWSTGRHRAGCRMRRYGEEFLTASGGGSRNGIMASPFRTRVSSLYYLEDLSFFYRDF
jgi:hypothetical protein